MLRLHRITWLAKHILQVVVGRWVDHDRKAVEMLDGMGSLSAEVNEAVNRRRVAGRHESVTAGGESYHISTCFPVS